MARLVFFPNLLEMERLQARKSQASVAKEAGCSLEQYLQWERGEGEMPSTFWVQRLARAIGCSAYKLAWLEEALQDAQ